MTEGVPPYRGNQPKGVSRKGTARFDLRRLNVATKFSAVALGLRVVPYLEYRARSVRAVGAPGVISMFGWGRVARPTGYARPERTEGDTALPYHAVRGLGPACRERVELDCFGRRERRSAHRRAALRRRSGPIFRSATAFRRVGRTMATHPEARAISGSSARSRSPPPARLMPRPAADPGTTDSPWRGSRCSISATTASGTATSGSPTPAIRPDRLYLRPERSGVRRRRLLRHGFRPRRR